jgi:serine/threonine protein kinase
VTQSSPAGNSEIDLTPVHAAGISPGVSNFARDFRSRVPERWGLANGLNEHSLARFIFSADIWAFGAVPWEMLTRTRLFHGETLSHTLAATCCGRRSIFATKGLITSRALAGASRIF